jgi:hypothetical protein
MTGRLTLTRAFEGADMQSAAAVLQAGPRPVS